MMRLLSWNVQWCRGIDGSVDPARIASEIRRLADPDVVCLQEIAVNFPELAGNDAADQAHSLAHLFPGYTACFVSGVDVPGANGRRAYFGNLLLSRLPVGRVQRHSLPWPSVEVRSMPRVAVEATIDTPSGALRVLTTHLEYYSQRHREAQVERLREIHCEARPGGYQTDEPGAFRSHARPASALVCGDFNMPPDNPLLGRMAAEPASPGVLRFVDAWRALNPSAPHPPTFCLHEQAHGDQPYCCDYVFVTEDLVPRLRSIRVDAETQASDHQPVVVEIA